MDFAFYWNKKLSDKTLTIIASVRFGNDFVWSVFAKMLFLSLMDRALTFGNSSELCEIAVEKEKHTHTVTHTSQNEYATDSAGFVGFSIHWSPLQSCIQSILFSVLDFVWAGLRDYAIYRDYYVQCIGDSEGPSWWIDDPGVGPHWSDYPKVAKEVVLETSSTRLLIQLFFKLSVFILGLVTTGRVQVVTSFYTQASTKL